MQTLRDWKVQRSGAGLRVTGRDDDRDVKIQCVSIEPRRGGLIIATDKDGTETSLQVQ